ncbi:MAG: hypothetical protein FWH43_06680, partial [Endomicrobia bacterium]|nr:hypothetical protein [Endomicrobiia bacterium]
MKKLVLFAVFFAIFGLAMSCSDRKNGGGNVNPSGNTNRIKVVANGTEVGDTLNVAYNQQIYMIAYYYKADGNSAIPSSILWQTTNNVGTLSNTTVQMTTFTASGVAANGKITIDCEGIQRSIDVNVGSGGQKYLTFEYSGTTAHPFDQKQFSIADNTLYAWTDENIIVKAVLHDSEGTVIPISTIKWTNDRGKLSDTTMAITTFTAIGVSGGGANRGTIKAEADGATKTINFVSDKPTVNFFVFPDVHTYPITFYVNEGIPIRGYVWLSNDIYIDTIDILWSSKSVPSYGNSFSKTQTRSGEDTIFTAIAPAYCT